MAHLRMRYFLFSVLAVMMASCSSYYKNLQTVKVDDACAEKIKPKGIATSWFDASVDVMGKHISGLLLIKKMPDTSNRIVFMNEAGVTFFDFAFANDGTFTVKQIISQLNKKAVIETFRKDFSLLLGIPFQKPLLAWHMGNEYYYGVTNGEERIYFTTKSGCDSLGRLEIGSKRKRMVSIASEGQDAEHPQKIVIKHFTFSMTIELKKIEKNAD